VLVGRRQSLMPPDDHRLRRLQPGRGKAMQIGAGRPAAGARPGGRYRRCGILAVPLAGLALSACVNAGQIVNLIEAPPAATVAFESVEGAPPAVSQKLVRNLEDEARARRIPLAEPGEANYRLRGYLATPETADGSIAWTLDVYDAGRRRIFRLSGQERAAAGAGAEGPVLQSLAHNGIDQLTAFLARERNADALATPAATAPPWLTMRVLDDWAPESAGIFRLLRTRAGAPEIDAATPLPPETVPLPAARPAPASTGERPVAFVAAG
jgi:hypothetical protein